MGIEDLFVRGVVLGTPLAILPGAFVDAAIHEARRVGRRAALTVPLQRALLEIPLFVAIAWAVRQLPSGVFDQTAVLGAIAVLLALWGWFLIDRTGSLCLRMDASYGRLRSSDDRWGLGPLLRQFWRSPWWWALWLPVAGRVAVDIEGSEAAFFTAAWWLRLTCFASGYFLASLLMAAWFAHAFAQRDRWREGDFFLLPNRSYRIAISATGTLVLFLGGAYGLQVIGRFVDLPVLAR